MKIKKILIIFMLFFITGCSTDYSLKISNNKFKENIDIIIPSSAIPKLSQEQIDEEIELDDQVTPFIEGKTSALTTYDKFYKKKTFEYDNYFNVQMDYSYDEEEFKNASSINLCFEYSELDFSDNYYINLQGKFYCLYSDSIDIKIETKNKVYYNNADEIQGNTYIWHIDESNLDYVDIKIDIDKGVSKEMLVIILFAIALLIGVVIIGYKFYTKNKEKNVI